MPDTIAYDLLVILASGLLAGLVCRWLRVSVLVGYLVVGALLGESCLGWIQNDRHELEYFTEAGVFLLLFSIGLEFSLEELWRLRRMLFVGGSAQMLLVALPIAAILIGSGMSWQATVLIAAAASFSSTVLVFKALSEWGHSSLPHGRRAIGILLFQDAALVPLLLLIPFLTGSGEQATSWDYLRLATTSAVFVVGVVLLRDILARWGIPMFAQYRSPELVVLFTLVSIGGVTYLAYSVGLPAAVGAFASGLIFNGNRWTKQVDALVLPFRETFAAIFFIGLGLLMDAQLIINEPMTMAVFLVAVISIKAVAAAAALRLTGLSWKSSIGMGVGLAHVGEFAFVLVLLGWEADVVSEETYQRLVGVSVGSLVLTPLLLKIGLRFTQADGDEEEQALPRQQTTSVGMQAIVIGAGPIGRQMASQLETLGTDVCVMDLSPINLHAFAQEGIRTVAGDASDEAILALARANEAEWIVVSVPHDETAVRVVKSIRKMNATSFVLVRCRFQSNISKLRKAGADQVVSEEVEASNALMRVLDQHDAASL